MTLHYVALHFSTCNNYYDVVVARLFAFLHFEVMKSFVVTVILIIAHLISHLISLINYYIFWDLHVDKT